MNLPAIESWQGYLILNAMFFWIGWLVRGYILSKKMGKLRTEITKQRHLLRIQRNGFGRSRMCLDRWPRSVQRQVEQRRCIVELGLPVTELPFQFVTTQITTLPDRIIGILDRQFRQTRRLTRQNFAIQRGDFPIEQPLRPRITDDVVHAQHEDEVLFFQSQHGNP